MRTLILPSLFGVVLVTAWGCGDSVTDCISTRTCSYSEEGGTSTDGGGADSGVVVPPGCDLTKDPKDAPACVDNGVGVFVAPTGNDSSSGSKELPVKTISKAVELAASRGLLRVYVCDGTYDAPVEIKKAVSLYGGLTCAWEYTGVKPKVAPSKGIALRVMTVTAPIAIADLEIVGAAETGKAGASAIAAFVSESTDVTFRNAQISAGTAADGADGTPGTNWMGTATNGSTAASGGAAVTCNCLDAATSSTGGKGGPISVGGASGSAVPAVGDLNGGGGGDTCLPGGNGANGLAKSAGTAASSSGTLSASGWDTMMTATSGGTGNPGQGGGGGGGRTGVAGGGGGACGGCGGAGGPAGGNGGSSFGVLSFNSNVTVDGGTIASGNAGRGGIGAKGQDGQPGGSGGAGACDGGSGGPGAGGSGGGGGAGGHSVPIGFIGTEPRVMGAMLTPGTKGTSGAGGAAGAGPGNAGAPGNAGPEGKAQNTLSL